MKKFFIILLAGFIVCPLFSLDLKQTYADKGEVIEVTVGEKDFIDSSLKSLCTTKSIAFITEIQKVTESKAKVCYTIISGVSKVDLVLYVFLNDVHSMGMYTDVLSAYGKYKIKAIANNKLYLEVVEPYKKE